MFKSSEIAQKALARASEIKVERKRRQRLIQNMRRPRTGRRRLYLRYMR